MAWTAPRTWVVGAVLTAAQLNTDIRDNSIDLDRRTTSTAAAVATSETSTSTTFTDLATVGPAVTVTIGSAGLALVSMYSALTNNTADTHTVIAYAVSGASTVAASDAKSLSFPSPAANVGARLGNTWLHTGLTAGSTTFTAKYRVGAASTGTWSDRNILVTPLGS